MRNKILCLIAVLVLLPLSVAQAGTAGWHIDDNGIKVYFRHIAEWTLVTPDNVEEYMELCISRGYTVQEVRERFASGRIVWEAYHKRMPDGMMRYEVWSDESTRSIWNLNLVPAEERSDWVEGLANGGCSKYTFVDPVYQSSGRNLHIIRSGVIRNPPGEYESGYAGMMVKNGLAMLVGYFQPNERASKRSYNAKGLTFALNEVNFTQYNELVFMPELLPRAVDLHIDQDFIVNEHTGGITFRGTSEKCAEINAAWGSHTGQTTAGADGAFEIAVPITVEGEMAVSLTAHQKGNTGNRGSVLSIPVDNAAARLTLTEYPYLAVDDQPVTVSGITAPGAIVFLTLNDKDTLMLFADADGKFTHTFEDVDYFLPQLLTVTANVDGLNDTTACLPFVLTYIDDVQKGIAEFKAKTIRLSAGQLAAHPNEHLGEYVRMEFRLKSLTHQDGGCVFEAESISGSTDKRYPMILKSNGYLDDIIVGGMNVTVYGIVEAPTNGRNLPQIRMVYVSYLKRTYK